MAGLIQGGGGGAKAEDVWSDAIKPKGQDVTDTKADTTTIKGKLDTLLGYFPRKTTRTYKSGGSLATSNVTTWRQIHAGFAAEVELASVTIGSQNSADSNGDVEVGYGAGPTVIFRAGFALGGQSAAQFHLSERKTIPAGQPIYVRKTSTAYHNIGLGVLE